MNAISDQKVLVGNVPVSVATMDVAVDRFIQHLVGQPGSTATGGPPMGPVRFVNAYSVALADEDRAYSDVLRGEGTNLPDGSPVAYFARLQNSDAGQVRGPTFFKKVIKAGVQHGVRHYFFGTDEHTLARLRAAIGEIAPGARVVGMTAPPIGTVEEIATPEAAEMISEAQPDVVWLGLGTPKQDYVGARLASLIHGLPFVSVGAAFDFVAGVKREAPSLFTRFGIEWVFRLLSEPRRLWHRYYWGNNRFFKIVLRQILRQRIRIVR